MSTYVPIEKEEDMNKSAGELVLFDSAQILPVYVIYTKPS